MRSRDKIASDFIAFVSYSHQDSRWAQWLHRRIETFALPKQLIDPTNGNRVGRLFLDRSELATSSDLSNKIEEALARSANLLVICSPAARRSRWVNEEIRRFRTAGKGDRIFCLIVAGDPASRGDDGCFPEALIEPIGAAGTVIEPLAADVRPGKDRPNDAKLKLIAGLIDVPYDALKRRAQVRRQRILMGATGLSLALLAVMTVLAITAMIARAEADRQRDTAQRTASFLGDLFDEARPERTGGKEITVRSMVDRAATSAIASPELQREPEVRARLLATLADVYAKLQLPSVGRTLTREANRFPISDKQTVLYRAAVDANLLVLSSDYGGLRRVLARAFAVMGDDQADYAQFAAQLLIARAQLAQHDNRPDDAERDYVAARNISLAAKPAIPGTAVNALLAAAVADVDAGRVDRAEARLVQVINEHRKLGEPLDPDVLTATNSLGAITIKRGDPVGAEGWFRRAIVLQSKVLGPASLDVALSRSNLGRALVEQRRFAEARRELLGAKSTYLREVGNDADVFANLEDSLGLALTGLREIVAAEAAFAHGASVARANEMPKQVELSTDLAELLCTTGRTAQGLTAINTARRALANFALSEPWRAARIDNVAGGCLLVAGRQREATPLIERSTPLVVARWGGAMLFGDAALKRLALTRQ